MSEVKLRLITATAIYRESPAIKTLSPFDLAIAAIARNSMHRETHAANLGAVSRIYAEQVVQIDPVRGGEGEKGEPRRREESRDLIKCSSLPVAHEPTHERLLFVF